MEDIKSLKINGQEVPLVKPTEVIVTIKNKKTGEIYKDEEALKQLIYLRRRTKRCIS
jgi:hypothetical protein